MSIRSEMLEAVTPASSYWRSEDSGYHTSYTPGSLELSEISNENLAPCSVHETKFSNNEGSTSYQLNNVRKYRRFKSTPIAPKPESKFQSPTKRRGIKRIHQEEDEELDLSVIQTPTSVIAGGIQRLNVNERDSSDFSSHFESEKVTPPDLNHASYPTTPIKKICTFNVSSSCGNILLSSPLRTINNLCCPPLRSAKKLSFANNTLPGETQDLKRLPSKVVRTIFKPEKKVDIVKALVQKVCCIPVITKIFSYLSSEDIYNFSLVSPTWFQVCEDVREANLKKQEHVQFINNTKENHENRKIHIVIEDHDVTIRNVKDPGSSLKDINNIVSQRSVKKTPKKSPPATPRTIKFKRFMKSALDSRLQLSCIRCLQPAKVTEEASGEEWAACSNISCGIQFCRYCKCDRHPGKACTQYDLNGPSPSKRRKNNPTIGSKKSKKSLRRLL